MDLRWPLVLAVGLPAAVVLAVAVHALTRSRRHRAAPVANSDALRALPEFRRALRLHRARTVGLGVAAAALVGASLVGAARPVDTTVQRPESRSRDIMLCLDVSGSMAAHDAELVRTFRALVAGFAGERIGLVIFNASAATVFPLTDDYDFINDELDTAEQALSDGDATGAFFAGTYNGWGTSLIGDGLATCVTSFDRAGTERARSVILATDNQVAGRQLIRVDQAAELAKAKGVRVYGLNPEAEGPDPEANEMRQLVVGTGGRYYQMTDRAAIAGIVESVQEQEATVIRSSARPLRADDPVLPIALAGGALVTFVALSRRRWRS